MRNEGGGFAASIYGAMPESRIQVTSHSESLIPAFERSLGVCRPLITVELLT